MAQLNPNLIAIVGIGILAFILLRPLQQAGGGIATGLEGLGTGATSAFTGAGSGFGEAFLGAGTGVSTAFEGVGAGVGNVATSSSGFVETVFEQAGGLIELPGLALNTTGEVIGNTFSNVQNFIGGFFG